MVFQQKSDIFFTICKDVLTTGTWMEPTVVPPAEAVRGQGWNHRGTDHDVKQQLNPEHLFQTHIHWDLLTDGMLGVREKRGFGNNFRVWMVSV